MIKFIKKDMEDKYHRRNYHGLLRKSIFVPLLEWKIAMQVRARKPHLTLALWIPTSHKWKNIHGSPGRPYKSTHFDNTIARKRNIHGSKVDFVSS